MDQLQTKPTPTKSPEDLLENLGLLSDSDALKQCIDVIYSGEVGERNLARTIIEAGLARGETQAREVEGKIALGDGGQNWSGKSEKEITEALNRVVGLDDDLRQLVSNYGLLYQARKRLDTYEILSPLTESFSDASAAEVETGVLDAPNEAEEEEMELDDPWAEGNNEDGAETTSPVIDDPWESTSVKSTKSDTKPIMTSKPTSLPSSDSEETIAMSLEDFLPQPILNLALEFASSASLHVLRIVFDRHAPELFPYRFSVLDGLPAWVTPGELKEHNLLPVVGDDGNEKTPEDTTGPLSLFDRLPIYTVSTGISPPMDTPLLDAEALSRWFTSRVESIDSVGALDLQLAWVQHGASLGIPNLDALGEDLSLLSRLIYDANLTPAQHEKWTLASWKRATESEIVSAYLANASPSTIVGDIRRLVLPYLYVLESRAERGGKPDTHLVERLLHDAVLSLPLHKALPVFDASKATIPMSERLLRNDQNVARLALACLYGSDEREVWSTMSGIFECLPVWDVSGGDLESDQEATAMTLDSIATFVRPHASSDKPPSAQDLFIFFAPLPFASLSRALDVLDVHLESGEILARWNTAVQLRFLLQSARDNDEQTQLAEKMVRRQAGMKAEKWTQLWEDMCKLNGGDDALLRGAFGTLSIEDMMRVYLNGILGSGNFDIARRMIRRFETEYGLSGKVLEEVALATSRELYDNAETGNIHTGDMKLAYDCLSIPTSSTALRNERSFIEATSRLASFSSLSLTPFQIRHAKNKLNLIRRVLSTSDDAYKHDTIIIELAEKLGLGDTASRGQIFGMLADAAVSHSEYDLAAGYTQRLIDLVKDRHKRRSKEEDEELRTVVWKTCLELGRQDEWSDIDSRVLLLGRATEYCPAETIPSILGVWRSVEDGSLKLSQAAKRRRLAGIKNPAKSQATVSTVSSPVVGSEEERVLGSRTAARAAKMALGFGERFKGQIPFSSGLSPHLPSLTSSREPSRDRSGGEGRSSLDSDRDSLSGLGFGTRDKTDAERVSRHARKALVRGVGWLLGADEREIQ